MQTDSSRFTFRQPWVRWTLLVAMTLIALAVVWVPFWLIRPFKPQTARALEISYELRHWSPIVTISALAIALLIGFSLWKQTVGWWRKAFVCILFLPLLIATWFARQNHFEWMFNPLPGAGFVTVNEASFVSDDDMILAVELNGDAVAYPVRQIAYHHVVQDVIGGIPVVATY